MNELKEIAATKSDGLKLRFVRMEWLPEHELHIVLEGRPWWEEGKDRELTVVLHDVVEAEVRFSGDAEFTRVSVAEDSPLLWDYGPAAAIYGNAPLPDVPRFFYEFFQLVRFKLSLPRDPAKYLNWLNDFSEWQQFALSRCYLLLRAPLAVAEAARELLEVQAAEYVLLPEEAQDKEKRGFILVTLGDAWFICRGASIN